MQSQRPAVLRKSFRSENGSRKDIPCSSQLHPLSAEPSSESGTGDRPTSAVNAGSARSKTPVGSAAPLTSRRTQSANRPPNSQPEVWQQQQQQQQRGALPDDDSLVLYKDPSYLSAQESVGSVVSGRFQDGDTFFTALRKDLSFQSDFDTADEQQAGVAGAASFLSCQLNPVQSPDSSAYFSAGGEASQSDAGGDSLQEESSRAPSLAACESSYAAARCEASCHDASSPLPPSQSVLDVINSLYCSQPASAASGRQARAASWQQQATDPDGLCLMAAGAASAPAVPAAPAKTAPADAVAAAAPDAETADALPAESSAPADKEPRAVGLACAAVAAADADAPAGDADADDSANSDDEAQAESSACLAHVEQLLTARQDVTAELSSYIAQLTSLADEGGQKLVEMPADYALMVERRLCECRSEYRALQGWEGPHRFSDLPIAQLPATHDDPDIAAGLAVIRQLDEQLREVWLKALVSARGSNPEQWAAAERQRLARRASELDEALAKERQRRMHAARLLRALHRLEGPEQGQGREPDLLLGPSKGLSSYSYYQLQARDEQLLAAVLSRDEADLEQGNPFDASAACLEPDAAASDAAEHGSEAMTCLDAAGTDDASAELAAGCAGSNGLSRLSSSSNSRRGRTLAEIDAQLEALHASGSQLMRQGEPSSRSSHKGSFPTASKRASLHSAGSSALPGSTSACQPPDGHGSVSSIASQARQARDFIREQREAKDLAQREHEVDAKLRALRTSELPAQLLPEQLATLLQEASSAALLPLGLPASLTAAC